MRKNIFACLFSIHNVPSLSLHKQVCSVSLRFERFRFLPSSNVVNDYVADIYNKSADLDRNNRPAGLSDKKCTM